MRLLKKWWFPGVALLFISERLPGNRVVREKTLRDEPRVQLKIVLPHPVYMMLALALLVRGFRNR